MSWNILKQYRHGEKPKLAKGPRAARLEPSHLELASKKGCDACPLNTERLRHPKMVATGAARPDVYILGEGPGEEEDKKGVQFVGPSGRLLRDALPPRYADRIRWDNVVDCRPPDNREPSQLEIACCRPRQERDIARSKPKLILGFGGVPLEWVLPKTEKPKGITAWRGRLIPVAVGGHHCWFMPLLHPAYILRARHAENGDAVEDLFRRDIETAFAALKRLEDPLVEDARECDAGVVRVPAKVDKVLAVLREVQDWPEIGIDIETTGIRPYIKDSRILSVALSNYETTYAVPLQHREAKFGGADMKYIFTTLAALLCGGSDLIAHNSKFEQEWLAYHLGPHIVHEGKWQDTMAQAYVLDEREGAKSLEAVSVQRLGMNVKTLGRPLRMDALDDEPLLDVLRYNAHDAKYTAAIYWLQRQMLEKENLLPVYDMMNARAGPFALAQMAGVIPDTAVAAKFAEEYKQKISAAERDIQRNKDVKAYVKEHGRFLPSSNKDLPGLFYHQLHYDECVVKDREGKPKKAKGGLPKLSCDEGVLSQIKHPVAELVLALRGYEKLHGTYITPLLEGGKHIWPDGLVHTIYNALLTSTGRTSSEDPNLQNFPMRDPVARAIRNIFVAPKGYIMVATDYGQIEARVIAMVSACPVLTAALWEGYDIHGEWARRLALAYPQRVGGRKALSDKVAMKTFRTDVKNQFTFPLFFGSTLRSVAGNLTMPEDVVRPLYDEFWQMFSAVHAWQKELRRFYQRNGYVESLTGRRRHAPLSLNEIINAPIQGTASDIVVDAGNRLSARAFYEERPQLQFRLNVHDDLTFYLPERSVEEDVHDIAKEMVLSPYSFTNRVPLTVEIKAGYSWGNLEEIGTVSSADYGRQKQNK